MKRFAPAIAYGISAAICCYLAATGKAHFIDMRVYRVGGDAVIHGRDLYQVKYRGLPFTYPPFSALIFTVWAALPVSVAAASITLASALLLPPMVYLAVRLPSPARIEDPSAAWRLALFVSAAAIWLEPIRTTLGYGQIDLVLAALILYDLSLPDGSRWKGTAIGLAAGIKLTPAIFLIYLVTTRRYRAAATGAAVFAATVAAGFAILPATSGSFWNGTFLNSNRISPAQDPENQSLSGVLTRNLHSTDVRALWIPIALVIGIVGLLLAARFQRSGNEAAGFSLCAITGLLISPISWTHHWTLAVPALVLAGVVMYRKRSQRRPLINVLGGTAIAATAVICWLRLAREIPPNNWLKMSVRGLVFSEIYVVIGLCALVIAAVVLLTGNRSVTRRR